jgi:hypothetical protein
VHHQPPLLASRHIDANLPLADITNTTRIAAVVANGRLFEQAELLGLLQAAGQPATTPLATPLAPSLAPPLATPVA